MFVSSTYEDLKQERFAVSQCLLENDCIPVGMEQFPSSNLNQLEYIKKMLDECDYYILILAGRYGSCCEDGIGYTEKEYDYADSIGIPILSFLVKDPEKLAYCDCETDPILREKLIKFRKKVSAGRLRKTYSDINSLKFEVATSISKCIRDSPAVGWIRGDKTAFSPSSFQELWEQFLTSDEGEKMFSRRTREILAKLSQTDAELFEKIAPLVCIYNDEYFLTNCEEVLAKYKVAYRDILMLQECGLIDANPNLIMSIRENKSGDVGMYTEKYALVVDGEDSVLQDYEYGIYLLTKAGIELFKQLQSIPREEYFLDFSKEVAKKNKGCHFSVHKRTFSDVSEKDYDVNSLYSL